MEQFYEKVINNTLNDIDKIHLKLILKKYSNRLEKYNETLDNLNSTDIHEIVKVKGRPKGTAKYTPEEKRESKVKIKTILRIKCRQRTRKKAFRIPCKEEQYIDYPNFVPHLFLGISI